MRRLGNSSIRGIQNAPLLMYGKRILDYAITDLTSGYHRIRVAKRTETTWTVGRFRGFSVPTTTRFVTPTQRLNQIEFIGDSETVGYGIESGKRTCTSDEIKAFTNTNVAFGPLVANNFQADYQINAISGKGLVRNYNGDAPTMPFPAYYDRQIIGVKKKTPFQKNEVFRYIIHAL